MHTVDLEYGEKHSKTWKRRNAHYRTRNKARNNKNVEKEMHTVGPGVWRENCKTWTMRTNTVLPEIWRETIKTWKIRNAHCKTWSMAGKLKIMKNEKHTL